MINFEKLSKLITKAELSSIIEAYADADKLQVLEINGIDKFDCYDEALSQDYDEEFWDGEYAKLKEYYPHEDN